MNTSTRDSFIKYLDKFEDLIRNMENVPSYERNRLEEAKEALEHDLLHDETITEIR